MGLSPKDMIAGIEQRQKNVIVLYEDLARARFPFPITNSDRAIVVGEPCGIQLRDDATRRHDNEIIGYELQIIG